VQGVRRVCGYVYCGRVLVAVRRLRDARTLVSTALPPFLGQIIDGGMDDEVESILYIGREVNSTSQRSCAQRLAAISPWLIDILQSTRYLH
jgi:hypothetical protein